MPSLQAANVLVGNDPNLEGLEMTMIGAKVLFHADAIVAITGAAMPVTIDKKPVEMWKSIFIKSGSMLNIGTAVSRESLKRGPSLMCSLDPV